MLKYSLYSHSSLLLGLISRSARLKARFQRTNQRLFNSTSLDFHRNKSAQQVQIRPLTLSALRMKKSEWVPIPRNKSRKKGESFAMKKQRSDKPMVKLFDGMSLRHLAVAVDMDFDSLYLQLLNIISEKEAEKFLDDPNTPLSRSLAVDIVAFLKMKPIWGPAPKSCDQEGLEEELYPHPPPPPDELVPRPPVVTIMGHVDHGKTTLLDALRKSNIVAGEFGGITQHIGAFSVRLPDVRDNRTVTFLDTPGHAAFRAMRERGARSTDIVVLVVAADDSVMEQTVESIRYAREADVPIIVAVNKCDKPGVDPEQVLHDLLQYDIVTEKFGGETLAVEISALYGRGLDKLQEAILLQTDFLELKSTPKGAVEGTIIESSNAQGLGNLCTLIVNRGVLRKGAFLVAGTCWGSVRKMSNEFGAQLDDVGPGMPVQVAGWRDQVPTPGELALEVESQQKAQRVVNYRIARKQELEMIKEMDTIEQKRLKIRQIYEAARMEKLKKGELEGSVAHQIQSELEKENNGQGRGRRIPRFALMLKCDVEGTLEAIQNVLDTYTAQHQVQLDVAWAGVGPLGEQELELARELGVHIFCFNTQIPQRVQLMAQDQGVPLEQFNIIYRLVERLKELLTECIPIVRERRLIGEGTVIHEYRIPDGLKKKQPVAGIHVEWGRMEKNNAVWRFLRQSRVVQDRRPKKRAVAGSSEDSSGDTMAAAGAETPEFATTTVYEGPIKSMQHAKDTITKATGDMEIGVCVEDKNVRYKLDDKVEVYEDVELPQQLEWHPPGF